MDKRFCDMGAPRRVWAVSAIHGELEKLYALHDAILDRLQAGDRIVYLGNYTGYGKQSLETVDEILTFRRLALSLPGMRPDDIIYLRGRQEDMWHKLTQLQFSNKPDHALQDMLDKGLAQTLESYDIDAAEGIRVSKEGVLSITRWTNKIREKTRALPGYDIWTTHYKRAAYTTQDGRHPMLFVNAGIAPKMPLEQQGENFYWSGDDFVNITKAYQPFEKVIRGYDPTGAGVHINCVTATLDGGSGFGGNLVGAGMNPDGKILEILEA